MGKTEAQIQRDKDFSSFEKRPANVDYRTKKQREAYRTKERNRAKLLADRNQWQRYREAFGNEIPDFESFRRNKVDGTAKYQKWESEYKSFRAESKKDLQDISLGQKEVGKKVFITEQSIDKVKPIQPKGFTQENAVLMRDTHRELLRHSKEFNNSNEVATLIDLKNNTALPSFIDGDLHSVDLESSTDAYHWLLSKEKNSLAMLHNHPNLADFSDRDIQKFLTYPSIRTITIVTNQGQVKSLTKTLKYDKRATINWMMDNYTGDPDKDVANFLKQCYNLGIERR